MSDHEARFIGFDGFDAAPFDHLAKLPDGAGAAAFYRHLGRDFDDLQRQERDWRGEPPTDV
jgi:hypothetical protein